MAPRPVHNDVIALNTIYVQVLPPVENERTVFYFLFCRNFFSTLLASSGVFFCPEEGGNIFIRHILKFREDSTVLRCVAAALSVKRLATAWKVRGSNLSEAEIFRTRPDRSGG